MNHLYLFLYKLYLYRCLSEGINFHFVFFKCKYAFRCFSEGVVPNVWIFSDRRGVSILPKNSELQKCLKYPKGTNLIDTLYGKLMPSWTVCSVVVSSSIWYHILHTITPSYHHIMLSSGITYYIPSHHHTIISCYHAIMQLSAENFTVKVMLVMFRVQSQGIFKYYVICLWPSKVRLG